MIRFTLLVIALYGICCAMAMGQSAPLTAGPRDNRDPRDGNSPRGGRIAPSSETPQPPAPMAGSGSMIRAAMAAGPDARRAKLSDVSLVAVAEPKPKLLQKHDLVTILIREDSQYTSKGTTDLKKNADLDAKIDAYTQLNVSKLRLKAITPAVTPEMKLEGSRDFKGDGTVDRTDVMTARIGAEVLDVKPNGTLVIQAHKHIKTGDEEQDLLLSGVCRAEDINADNTILSNQLHDLDIRKTEKGAVRDTNKRGWVPSLLDFINPF